jgi:hypothetical protein
MRGGAKPIQTGAVAENDHTCHGTAIRCANEKDALAR